MSLRYRVILYVMLAVASGFTDLRMRAHPLHGVTDYIPQVVAGTAEAPGRYRVLAPFTVRGFADLTGIGLTAAWYLTRLGWFLAAYLILDQYLRTWCSPAASLAGTLLVAATLPLTFTNSWPHPDHIPELALFTLGCLAVARRREVLFAVALALAALNRETAGFLVLLYAVAGRFSRQHLWYTALFALEFLLIAVGLRAWRGFESYQYWQLANNISFLRLLPAPYDPYYRAYAYFFLVLFGPLALVALARRPQKPLFARRALWVVPPFLLVACTISSIIETRIFTPLYPLLLPAVVVTLFSHLGCSQSEALTSFRVSGG